MTSRAKTTERNDTEAWLDGIDPATHPARDATDLRKVGTALSTVEAAERALRDAIKEARAAGESWAAIGTILGTSRQAAWERFSPRT